MTLEQLEKKLEDLKYYPGGYITEDGDYITGRYTMYYGSMVEEDEEDGFEISNDAWISSVDSDFEEFDFPDAIFDIDGFDPEDYIESIKEAFRGADEVHNKRDWEYQK
jgi:hypothetical protein